MCRKESTHIYFDEEFSRSFEFKVIGKMIDDDLYDTSLKSINALYHKYRVEMLVDKEVEGEAEVEAEHGILGLSTEQAIKMIRKREPAALRESVQEHQFQETIVRDVSKWKLLSRSTVDNLVPWYHEMLLHIRHPKAFHWKSTFWNSLF